MSTSNANKLNVECHWVNRLNDTGQYGRTSVCNQANFSLQVIVSFKSGMFCMERAFERRRPNGNASVSMPAINHGLQILLFLFSASGSLGHETIDPICHGKSEYRASPPMRITPISAARRSPTQHRSRHLANLVLIPTVSNTVIALRQGT